MLPDRQIKYLYEELGNRIKNGRIAQGYKQEAFASLLKISRASLVNIERGRQRPPLHNLYEISRLIKIPLAEMLPSLVDENQLNSDSKFEKEVKLMSSGNVEIQEKLMSFIKTQQSTHSK